MSGYQVDPRFVSACACMGPVYGEPFCPCEMKRQGLKSSPAHIEANEKANEDMKKLFAPGGIFHQVKRDVKA